MSEVVLAIAASHSTLMNTHWDRTSDRAAAEAFVAGLERARAVVAAANPDVAVVIGSNHFRGMWLDLMPAFTLGVGIVTGTGEAGTLAGPLPTDPKFARSLCEGLVARRFDMAFSLDLHVDHGITQATERIVGPRVPIVPLIVNVFAPPLPPLDRCEELGRAIRTVVSGLGGSRRVAIIASGGLSHSLPWPDWRSPDGGDDEFMVEAWTAGRSDWKRYEPRRREIILAAEPRLAPDWDRAVLDLFAEGRGAELCAVGDDLSTRGGNGANELRTWLMAAAASGHQPGYCLAYEPIPEWLTAMGVVAFVQPELLEDS